MKFLNKTDCFPPLNDFNSDFAAYFKLNTIPRYILLDANGNLLKADAPRPGDPKEYHKDVKQQLMEIC